MKHLVIFFRYCFSIEELNTLVHEMQLQGLQVEVLEQKQNWDDSAEDEVIVFTDDALLATQCKEKGISYLFLLQDSNKYESIPSGAYCVEKISDVSFDYLDKVYRRAKGIPWEILTTERLIIREITVEDVERLYELYADESITRYMEPLFPTQQQEEDYTRDYIKNIYHFYGYGMWLITLRQSGEVIGRAGLEYKEGFDGLELGFMLGKDYQHKGYAYEACKAILDYAREELEQTCFRAEVHKENDTSKRLCKKLGFELSAKGMEEEIFQEYCIN